MFTKIFDSLRTTNSNTNTIDRRYPSVPDINVERRSSFDDEADGAHVNESKTISRYSHNDGGKQTTSITTTTTTTSTGDFQASGSNAIGITPGQGGALGTDPVFVDVRRRSSLFGYSRNAADDYMQKDLLSSSWS